MEPINLPISNANKKLKLSSVEEEEDKLRNLPEPILHYILSFLDLKEAGRTSVLSTRWRCLWASLPFLNFEFRKDGKAKAFREFVDKVLLLRDPFSNIQCFRLDCNGLKTYGDRNSSCLNTWILTALKRNLEECYLNLAVVEEGFRLPHSLFTCESLTKLELKKASDSKFPLELNIPDSMSLPRLITLLLHCVTIEGDDIFSKCPCLESLTITNCEFRHQSHLLFDAPKLKHLVIENLYYRGVDKKGYNIKINAPNLISFHCKDYMSNQYSRGQKLSALVKADIGFKMGQFYVYGNPTVNKGKMIYFVQRMVEFMGALHNVETLTLSESELFLQNVGAAVISRLNGIKFRNLRCLKLVVKLTEYSAKSIRKLLNISPNIETLFLEKIEDRSNTSPWYQYLDEVTIIDRAKVETSWNLEVQFQNMWCQLKSVEIRGVQGLISEFLFLGLLLKHGKVLENLRVFTSKKDSSHRERRLMKFAEKLLTLPRASSTGIAILFF